MSQKQIKTEVKLDCNKCVFERNCCIKCWLVDIDKTFIPEDWKEMLYMDGKWYELSKKEDSHDR